MKSLDLSSYAFGHVLARLAFALPLQAPANLIPSAKYCGSRVWVAILALLCVAASPDAAHASSTPGGLVIITAGARCAGSGSLSVAANSLPDGHLKATVNVEKRTIHVEAPQGQYAFSVTEGRCAADFTAGIFEGVTRTLAMSLAPLTRSDEAPDLYQVATDAVLVRLPTDGMYVSATVDGHSLAVFADGHDAFIDSVPRGSLLIKVGGANFANAMTLKTSATYKLYVVWFDFALAPHVTSSL